MFLMDRPQGANALWAPVVIAQGKEPKNHTQAWGLQVDANAKQQSGGQVQLSTLRSPNPATWGLNAVLFAEQELALGIGRRMAFLRGRRSCSERRNPETTGSGTAVA